MSSKYNFEIEVQTTTAVREVSKLPKGSVQGLVSPVLSPWAHHVKYMIREVSSMNSYQKLFTNEYISSHPGKGIKKNHIPLPFNHTSLRNHAVFKRRKNTSH